MWKRLWQQEDGQTLIMAALLLSVLLGFAALVIDVGYFYSEKRQLQTAVDSAALAGALVAGETTDTIRRNAAVNQYLYNNLDSAMGSLSEVKVHFEGAGIDSVEVSVYAKDEYPTFFAKILGIQTTDISAKAKAKLMKGDMDPFDYALFSGDQFVTFNGAQTNIIGDVYAKTGVDVNNNMTIQGDVTTPSNITLTSQQLESIKGQYYPGSTPVQIVDYSPLLEHPAETLTAAQFEEKYIKNNAELNGLVKVIFTNSNDILKIKGTGTTKPMRGKGIIYTNGFLEVHMANEPTASFLYYSERDITITSSDIFGTVYAPNGNITVNGDPQVPVKGRIIAGGGITLNGGQLKLDSSLVNDDWLKGLRPISKLIE